MTVIHPAHGYLTANETTAIKAIRRAGLSSGKAGRTEYFMRMEGFNVWSITIRKAGRGLGFIGEPLRKEQRTLKIEIPV